MKSDLIFQQKINILQWRSHLVRAVVTREDNAIWMVLVRAAELDTCNLNHHF